MKININQYLGVISAIGRKYEDEISNNKKVYINIKDFLIYEEDLKILRYLLIIDNNNIVNNERFLLAKNYIDRRLKIDDLDFDEVKEILDKVKDKFTDGKGLWCELDDKKIKTPSDIRFHDCTDLDIISMIQYHGIGLIKKLLGNSKNLPKINAKDYYIENSNLIFNNGERIIQLGNTESIILKDVICPKKNIFIEDFTKYSINPIAVIKKIRKKIKDNKVEKFIIQTRKMKYSGKTKITIINN